MNSYHSERGKGKVEEGIDVGQWFPVLQPIHNAMWNTEKHLSELQNSTEKL